jgi:hypothetical protein
MTRLVIKHPIARLLDRLRREETVVRLGLVENQRFNHEIRTARLFEVSEPECPPAHDPRDCGDERVLAASRFDLPLVPVCRIAPACAVFTRDGDLLSGSVLDLESVVVELLHRSVR